MRLVTVLILLVLLFSSTADCATEEGIVYSAIFPGWGQIKSGRYGRGALFMTMEVVALTGIVVANIQYDRDIEALDRSRSLFKIATYIGDAQYYNDQMKKNWEDADGMNTYRKVLTGAAIGIWSLSMIDMIWGDDPENVPISMRINKNEFFITKSFKF
ncbi:MAG: DUF5683 domain-containing protein [Candidatus Krumholzibacteriota bacterium]|nr:DUF5683 domain-containing protein [Candidatus Krumholzibacteriota bacterium]